MKLKSTTLIVALATTLFLAFCSKNSDSDDTDDPKAPTLATKPVTAITESTASCGGTISGDGGEDITAKGIVWSIDPNPTLDDDEYTEDGVGTDAFDSEMTGLASNTTYYVRAYAINSVGIAYGNQVTFKTEEVVVTPPCSPAKNSVKFGSQNQTFYFVGAGAGGLVYGDYGLVANGNDSDLAIDFGSEPATGLYTTIGATSFIGANECVVNGTFGGTFSYHYVGDAGATVYVVNNGGGKYSMTFCGVTFRSGGTTLVFTSDGNLTTE